MSKRINCLVVDDEPLAREGLIGYVEQIDFLQCAGQAADPIEALTIIGNNSIDLILLDIQMPKLTGLDFLKTLSNPPLIIITTAYPSFALEGYQLDVLDYLVKPITFQRFLKSALKAKKQFSLLHPAANPSSIVSEDHLFIKTEGRIERIDFEELLFVESMQNYVHFHTKRGKFTALAPLKKVLDQLPEQQFLQVHKSYIVSKDKILTIDGNVLTIGDHRIPVSRNRFEKMVGELLKGKLLK